VQLIRYRVLPHAPVRRSTGPIAYSNARIDPSHQYADRGCKAARVKATRATMAAESGHPMARTRRLSASSPNGYAWQPIARSRLLDG
jgi:hypothetical protein